MMRLSRSEDELFDALINMQLVTEDSNSKADPERSSNQDTDTDTVDAGTNLTEKPRITFLDLPENVKIKILRYAGLLRPCLINIASKQDHGSCRGVTPVRMFGLARTGDWVHPYHGPPCDHPRLPVEVFLASRAARDELGPIFFSHNRFSTSFFSKSEYKIFCAATDWGLQHMKYLHIDMGPYGNRFLKLGGAGLHRMIMNIWTGFCSRAKERMPALRFFSMRCRVKDLEVAYRLMRAMDPFPLLSHCAFHLNQSQNNEIWPVIKRAAWRLTDNLGNKPPFPFLRLPKEVQLLILEHLLINRLDPYVEATERSPGIVSFQDRKRLYRSFTSPLSCCGTCSVLRVMCFCLERQTAFSTSCSCFSSPLPYFLVSRDFYEDCRRVFFSNNNFAFVEDEPESIMRLMHCIPTLSFMQIRHLSFKFPLTYRNFPKAGRGEDTAILSWSVLRRFIREHFDLSRLSITIVDFGTKGGVSNRSRYMRKMLKAFADLRGLRDFRVYLDDDRLFEKEVERAVLGPASNKRPRRGRLPFVKNVDP